MLCQHFIERCNAKKIMMSFLKGEMDTESFWRKYQSNKIMQRVLIKDKTRKSSWKHYDFEKRRFVGFLIDDHFELNPDNLLEKFDITKLGHRARLVAIVRDYFVRRNKQVICNNRDIEEFDYFYDMVPDWAGPIDFNKLQEMMNAAPAHLSKRQKQQWGKEKIIQLFPYDDYPPKWLQGAEWPSENGEYLIFLYQKTDPKDCDHEYYHFYNPKTKQKVVVAQYS